MGKKLKILAAGDLHGDKGVARKLSRKAKREKVDLVVLAGDVYGYGEGEAGMLEVFAKNDQKVVFVPGNCDFDEEVVDLEEVGKNLHGRYASYGDVGILGIGSGNWKLELDSGDLGLIRDNFSRMKHKKRILVSHLHAAGTKTEKMGLWNGKGDDVLRHAVEKFKPDMLIAGHIHEAEGIEEMIGGTRVFQVGEKGTVLEI